MVVLTTRFAVLGAFVYLASLSLTPLSVGAAAIHKPSLKERSDFPLPMPLPLDTSEPSAPSGDDTNDSPEEDQNQARSATWPAQLKSTKRHHHHHHHYAHLIDVEILKAQAQHHLHARHAGVAIPNEHGASYRVVSRAISDLARRRVQDGVPGHVDIMSPDSRKHDGEKIGSLALDNQVDDKSADNGYTLYASESSATPIYLVDAPSTSRAQSEMPDSADSNVPVILQIPMDESSEPLCATYSTESSDQPLTAEKCEKMDSGKSQTFAYNRKTRVIQPEFGQGSRADSVDSAQGVLERADGATARNVTLMFVPDMPRVADVEGAAITSTSTTTTTVTVTGADTATLSAAGVDATSSAGASPTSTPALTSADPSAPTAASADRLDVQVVGPANSSTAMLTSASEAAAPTSTINAQDVAAGIAASSSQPTLATDASAITPTAAPFSSPVAPSVAAAADSTPTSSGTTASVAPTMGPFSTEPYKWVFRRE